MIPDACPKCGGPIQLWDKDTSTGRDILTYGCDACKWHESFDEGIALWKAMSDANEEFSKSKPLETRTEDAEIQREKELTEKSVQEVLPASEPSVITNANFETPRDHAVKDRPSTELSAEAETEATVIAGDDPTGSIRRDNLSEGERQAYLDGYNDCFSYRHTPFGYNPPTGYEKAYKEGWEARRLEEDEQMMREWTGLP